MRPARDNEKPHAMIDGRPWVAEPGDSDGEWWKMRGMAGCEILDWHDAMRLCHERPVKKKQRDDNTQEKLF